MNWENIHQLLRDFHAPTWHVERDTSGKPIPLSGTKKTREISNRVSQYWIETGGDLPNDIVDLKTALFVAVRCSDHFRSMQTSIYVQALAEKLDSLHARDWKNSAIYSTSGCLKEWREKYTKEMLDA